jgi:hypothetical protein
MLPDTVMRAKPFAMILLILTTLCGCWKFRPTRWHEEYAKTNFMRFRIGVQEFESFVPASDNGTMVELSRMPSATTMETQCSIFAVLRDREENVIELYIYMPSFEPGKHIVSDSGYYSSPISLAWFSVQGDGHRRNYRTSPTAPAIINIIEYDTTKRILRGTFTMEPELPSQRLTRSWPRRLSLKDGVFEIRSITKVWDDNPFRR